METFVYLDTKGTEYRAKYLEGIELSVKQEAAVFEVSNDDPRETIPILLKTTVKFLIIFKH